MEVYLVGGAVRDRLLGIPPKEKDYVVVGALVEELLQKGFKPVGKDFPVFLHPETHEEYALARTERKEGKGYTGFKFYAAKEVTLAEDLKRRDLTINAIAEKLETGEIIDPYQGCYDLEQKILRHVSPAFVEDPVRILRVGRFMARFSDLGFQVADSTFKLMQTIVENGEVDALVPERIWKEFERALGENSPTQFIETLEKCGAWRSICPEWQIVSDKARQSGLEKLAIATTISRDTVVRFSALMQSLKKNACNTELADALSKRWRLPKVYKELLGLSIRYVEKMHKAQHLSARELLEILERTDAIRRYERFNRLLLVCEIDWRSQAPQNTQYTQKKFLLAAVKAIQSVSISTLIEAKLEGVVFSDQLKQLRIQTLERLILKNKSDLGITD